VLLILSAFKRGIQENSLTYTYQYVFINLVQAASTKGSHMQTAVLSTTSRIPFGTPVLHYNLWTGFETDRFRDQFKHLSGKDVSDLDVGATVFVDVDPIHWRGKVYGRFKGTITVIKMEGDSVFVGYECEGAVRGIKRIQLDAQSTDFATANDEDALADILDELPLAKVIDNRR
jgi:ribosomal protein L21E